MDIEPVQKALDSSGAHVAGFSLWGFSFTSYLEAGMQLMGFIYLAALGIAQIQKVYSNYRLGKKGKFKDIK